MNQLAGFMLAIVFLTACRKSGPGEGPVVSGQGVVKPAGTIVGITTTKTIGVDGGLIQSPDGRIRINVPAGAVNADIDFSLTPITNTNSGGLGKGWRIIPHGQTFQQPVTITIDYTDVKDSVSMSDALAFAYQDAEGIWQCVGRSSIDTLNKKISVTTNHFSDWVIMSTVTLKPVTKEVNGGESVTLEVLECVQPHDEDDDIFVPIPSGNSPRPVRDYAPLSSKYIKQWILGGAGNLQANGNKATYLSPAVIDEEQVVAVSVELKAAPTQTNSLWLVSNLTLVGNKPKIYYLEVDEKNDVLYIHGNGFGTWGGDEPVVKINNYTLETEDIITWFDEMIQCKIPPAGPNSSGEIRVTAHGHTSEPHILNEWNLVMNYFRPQGRQGQSIHEKITFRVRLRGDTAAMPDGLESMIVSTYANQLSLAQWEAGGTGQSQVECFTYTMNWTNVSGTINHSGDAAPGGDRWFRTNLKPVSGGFDLMLNFELQNAIPAILSVTHCTLPPMQQQSNDWITFSDFEFELFELRLNGRKIEAGSVSKNLPANTGLQWPAAETPNYMHEVKVQWEQTEARW